MEYKNAYIKRLISRMTLDQKVGQMMTLGFAGVVAKPNVYEYITKYHCGGLRLSPEFRVFGNYVDPNSKAPAWTGVQYLYQFLTRANSSVGPVAVDGPISAIRPGDLIQLSFDGMRFTHTPVVVSAPRAPSAPGEILIAAHSYDSDNRPLDSYQFQAVRYLHIVGVNRPV